MLARSSLRVAGGLTTAAIAGGGGIASWSMTKSTTTTTQNQGSPSTLLMSSSSSSSHLDYQSSLVIPTLQATGRALRLAQTAVLIAADYKTAEWWGQNRQEGSSSDEEEEQQLDYWEAEAEERRKALELAQATHSTESHPDLDLVSLLEVKRKEKEEMNRAAEALAEADEMLAALGSRKSRVHRKAAHRLLQLCHENRGVYIKVGQHLANLDYLIPQEYIETLSALFDDNPRTSYEDVKEVIREDLGADVDQLFDDFDPVPIASASLAQVHVAYEKGTGRKLAIKVQHRGLRETCVGDIAALVFVVRAAERIFEGFSWGWLADEIAPQLPKELDFENEGRNAERASENIKKTGLDCVIPKILWECSSPRVLTMEFEEGFKATDVEAIEKAGFKKQDVANLISSVFSSQVFQSAFVHCDPHPANVLLRPSEKGTPQMVLVDHGLYRELDSDFCRRYAALWKSLMLADLDGIKNACESLGITEAYRLFAAMLTARPFDELVERSKKGTLRNESNAGSRADHAVIRGYAQRFLQQIFDMLGTVPRQMLLLLKMNDCLRHIDYSLGSPTNTMVVCGKYAARSIYDDTRQNSTSLLERLRAWYSYFQVLLRIKLHDTTVWWLDRTTNLRIT